MNRWFSLAGLAVLVVLALGLAGCSLEREKAELSQSMQEIITAELKTAWQSTTGEVLADTPKTHAASGLSESHSVMASMILMGRGMDSDLSKYKDLYLVEFRDAGGVERAAVYADGKVILPAGAGQ